jgi:hypothetical protein
MSNQHLAIVEIVEINQPQHNEEPSPKSKAFPCRHIFTDGRRCGSHALREQHFCYYHYAHRNPALLSHRRKYLKSGFDLTRLDGLDNPTSIQLALTEVLGRIATNTVDPKRGALLLYGLQIAGNNLRRSRPHQELIPEAIVEDADHGQLAELEEGRIVPESMLARMTAALHSAKTDPAFQVPEELPEDFKQDLKDLMAQPASATKRSRKKLQGQEITPSESRL